jgi:chromate transporter
MPPSFAQAVRFWHRLGWISFGGPAGQIAIMHAEVVERRRWVDDGAFVRALNYCMLLPGPEAMQLATYLGWRLHGVRGGLAAGALFVLPAVFVLAMLSWIYLNFGAVPAVQGALFGIQAAVLGILAQAVLRLGRRVLGTAFALALALIALCVLVFDLLPFPALVGVAALLGVVVQRVRPGWLKNAGHGAAAADATPPSSRRASVVTALGLALALLLAWWLPILALGAWLGPDSTAFGLGMFFSRAALVTFGGAYAVLPYVAEQAVNVHGWLGAGQMLVGLGLAESTPGPLIMVVEFVGFVGAWQHPDLSTPLTSALLGAAVTVWATFLPSFLFVLPMAPWIESLHRHAALQAALAAVSAAVVGVIASLALWFGWHLLSPASSPARAFAVVLALSAWIVLTRWQWKVEWVVVVAALLGATAIALGLPLGSL